MHGEDNPVVGQPLCPDCYDYASQVVWQWWVAFNAWQYFQASADAIWFASRGAELIIEVARFFSDLAVYDEGDQRFHIPHGGGAVGDAESSSGCALPRRNPEPVRRVRGAGGARLGRVPPPIRQHREAGPHPRVRGDTTNHYRLSKQADVLMLLYLLGLDETLSLLDRLGYRIAVSDLVRTADYYFTRSSNGSTLARVVHTSVLAMLDRCAAWSEFREAVDADLDDTQGGTTGHGIHLGAMAGTVDTLLRTYTGVRVEADTLVFAPQLPGALRRLGFELRYRGQRITVALSSASLHLCRSESGSPIPIRVYGVSAQLKGGESVEYPIGLESDAASLSGSAGRASPCLRCGRFLQMV